MQLLHIETHEICKNEKENLTPVSCEGGFFQEQHFCAGKSFTDAVSLSKLKLHLCKCKTLNSERSNYD